MSDPWKDVRFTNGRDRLKEGGWGTRLLTHVFMSVVGAGGGVFFALYMVGGAYRYGSGQRAAAASSESIISAIIAFGVVGALVGFCSVFVLWPRDKRDREE